MWKNTVERCRLQMAIRRKGIACWIPKATDTQSEYGTFLVFHGNKAYANAPRYVGQPVSLHVANLAYSAHADCSPATSVPTYQNRRYIKLLSHHTDTNKPQI